VLGFCEHGCSIFVLDGGTEADYHKSNLEWKPYQSPVWRLYLLLPHMTPLPIAGKISRLLLTLFLLPRHHQPRNLVKPHARNVLPPSTDEERATEPILTSILFRILTYQILQHDPSLTCRERRLGRKWRIRWIG
jgi:hypothetical protein